MISTRKPVLKSAPLLIGSALLSGLGPWASQSVLGQVLEEVIVTAQKREQSVQDVPIAVTALGTDALEANRVIDVVDLSSLAPGFWAAPTAGASQVPQFSMRGITGNGVVPGSDRQVSLYIDDVYLASPRGSIFDLPNIERIEVLRGPQGTLFGRNATAGAVSITTRAPTGETGVKGKASLGNYNQERYELTVDSPEVAGFSGYISFVTNNRDGDIRNTNPGQRWDRTSSRTSHVPRLAGSPKRLGDENSESLYAALRFERDAFSAIYRYDDWDSEGTPRGTGFVGYDTTVPLLGSMLTGLIEAAPYPVPITPNGKRPNRVSNGYAVKRSQKNEGHNLTFNYEFSEGIVLKNVFGYRESNIFGASPLDGFSSLILTSDAVVPAATIYAAQNDLLGQLPSVIAQFTQAVGSPYVGTVNQAQGRNKQISDELQLNYESDLLTATLGALWFKSKDYTGETYFQNTVNFQPIPGGVITNTNFGETYNEITSTAAYTQLEFHLNPHLDLVLGGRVTKDDKKGSLTYGPDLSDITVQKADYEKTKFNYLLGVNYTPEDDLLLYGKYSTAYVSGGSTAGIAYDPEEAESWEAGIKADFFANRLRTNLAIYYVEYSDVQGPQSPTTPGSPEYIEEVTGNPELADVIGTFVATIGDRKAKGFELDVTAAPIENVTVGGNFGYTDPEHNNVPAGLERDGQYEPIFIPDCTGSLWAQYDLNLGSGDMYASFRMDGTWQSDVKLTSSPSAPEYQGLGFAAGVREIPSHWVVNGRAALNSIKIGGADLQIALWGKNLGDDKSANYAIPLVYAAVANYIPARTYGMDLTVEF